MYLVARRLRARCLVGCMRSFSGQLTDFGTQQENIP